MTNRPDGCPQIPWAGGWPAVSQSILFLCDSSPGTWVALEIARRRERNPAICRFRYAVFDSVAGTCVGGQEYLPARKVADPQIEEPKRDTIDTIRLTHLLRVKCNAACIQRGADVALDGRGIPRDESRARPEHVIPYCPGFCGICAGTGGMTDAPAKQLGRQGRPTGNAGGSRSLTPVSRAGTWVVETGVRPARSDPAPLTSRECGMQLLGRTASTSEQGT